MHRRLERKYNIDKIIEIENIPTSDPKQVWKAIHKLGPKSKKHIPVEVEVYNEDGNIQTDMNKVLNQWSLAYEMLYTFLPGSGTFYDQFFNGNKQNFTNIEQNGHILEGQNHRISLEEVDKVISNSKNNKSVGIDNLPNEIFKNKRPNTLLTAVFNKILDTGLTPSIWGLYIIKPIPKNSMIDPRLLQYRGISLLSTIYQFYISILNSRLTDTAERNNIFNDEQNIFSLTSIIRNHKNKKTPYFHGIHRPKISL